MLRMIYDVLWCDGVRKACYSLHSLTFPFQFQQNKGKRRENNEIFAKLEAFSPFKLSEQVQHKLPENKLPHPAFHWSSASSASVSSKIGIEKASHDRQIDRIHDRIGRIFVPPISFRLSRMYSTSEETESQAAAS